MLRSMIIMLSSVTALFAQSCVSGVDDDLIEKTRSRLESKVCSAKTSANVTDVLKAEGVDYFTDQQKHDLRGNLTLNKGKLVSTSVLIEVEFDTANQVKSCRVYVLHTGP